MMGWICPVCGDANSPFQNSCVNGPHARTETSSSTNVYPQCTCGTTIVCQKHRTGSTGDTVTAKRAWMSTNQDMC